MSSNSFNMGTPPSTQADPSENGLKCLIECFFRQEDFDPFLNPSNVINEQGIFLPNKSQDAYLAYSAPASPAPKELLSSLNQAVYQATSNNQSGTTASFATLDSQGNLHFSVLGDSPVFLVLKDPQLVIKLSVDMDIKSDFYTSLYLGHRSDQQTKCYTQGYFKNNPFGGLACAGAYGDQKSFPDLLKKSQYYDFSSESILSKRLEAKLAELLGDQKTSSIQDMIQAGAAKVLVASDGWAPEKTKVLAHDYELSFDFLEGIEPYYPLRAICKEDYTKEELENFEFDRQFGVLVLKDGLGTKIAEWVAESKDFLPDPYAFKYSDGTQVQVSFKKSTPPNSKIIPSQEKGIPSIYHVLAYPQDHQDVTLESLLRGAYRSSDDQSAYVLPIPKQKEQISVVTLFDGHGDSNKERQAYENAIAAVKEQMQSIFQPNTIAAVAPDSQQISATLPTSPTASFAQNNGLRPLTPPKDNNNQQKI